MNTRHFFFAAIAGFGLTIASCGDSKTDGAAALTSFDACSCATVKDTNSEDYKKCKGLREQDAKFESDFQKCLLAHNSGMDTNQVKLVAPGTNILQAPVEGTYTVDAINSSVTWRGEKVTGKKHQGNVNLKSGTFTYAAGNLTSGEVVIDMNTIKVTGEDAGSAEKLAGHLKSDDFFGSAKFPEAKFVVVSSTPTEANKFSVKGNLTIKGITKEVTTVMTIAPSGNDQRINGAFIFDRSQFDVRYGSDTFFDNLGDDLIKNEVILTFDLKGKK